VSCGLEHRDMDRDWMVDRDMDWDWFVDNYWFMDWDWDVVNWSVVGYCVARLVQGLHRLMVGFVKTGMVSVGRHGKFTEVNEGFL